MASPRQIEANRRNARKSTGPRSGQGKRRAARNAVRHGLSFSTGSFADDERIEQLAQRICADFPGELVLPDARAAAHAQLNLAQIRALKAEVVNRAFLFGAIEQRLDFRSTRAALGFMQSLVFDRPLRRPPRIDPGPMPAGKAARMGEALRRSIEELRKLDRYERRAHARLGRAINRIVDLKSHKRASLPVGVSARGQSQSHQDGKDCR